MKKTREEKNGIVIALFLFQYSLLIPLMSFIKPTILILISGILLIMSVLIINKRLIINLRSAAVIVGLSFLMLCKTLIDATELKVLVNFLEISIPPLIVFSYRFDQKSFLKTSYKLSYVNFLLLAVIPFIGSRISYMRFGYGMVVTVLFSYLTVFRRKVEKPETLRERGIKSIKAVNIAILIASTFEAVVYGSRGVLVVILVFIATDVFLIYRSHIIRNLILIGAGFVAVFNIEKILKILIRLAGQFGVNSYALRKYQYQLATGLEEASSGRGGLYRTAIESIRRHPFIGERMIIYDDGTLYVHNLFLQIGRDLGVVMMIVSVLFVAYCLYLFFTRKVGIERKTIIAVFFCISVGRLLISSNVWERPEFWALVCLVLNHRYLFGEQDIKNEAASS